jgi:methylated-DNA-protein-cysteine methyltransferase-like protein
LDSTIRATSSFQPASEARRERILARIRAIPEGFVRTYGDLDPAAPRLVGHVLATHWEGEGHSPIPWHRVVRADGSVAVGEEQLELLRREGVPMRGDRVDLSRARLPPEAA